jgi:hypothetical protein
VTSSKFAVEIPKSKFERVKEVVRYRRVLLSFIRSPMVVVTGAERGKTAKICKYETLSRVGIPIRGGGLRIHTITPTVAMECGGRVSASQSSPPGGEEAKAVLSSSPKAKQTGALPFDLQGSQLLTPIHKP